MPSNTNPLTRGQIVRVRFNPVEGSEQGGTRPALVLSPGVILEHSPIILVAPLTSKKTERVYPFEAIILPPEGGLALPSKVLLTHIRGVDKTRVEEVMGIIGNETMARVEDALKIATGLGNV